MPFRLPAGLSPHRIRKLWYAPVLALGMGLMMVRLLIMARILDLPGYAVYSAGLLVSSSFLMLGCLGLNSILQRELPMLIVRRRENAGGVLLMQSGLVAIFCALLFATLVLLSQVKLAGLTPKLLVIAIIHGLSLQLFLVATIESRSRGEPLRFAFQNLNRALILLVAGSAVAASGLCATVVLVTEAVSSLLCAVWLFKKQFDAINMRLIAAVTLAWRRLTLIPWHSALAFLAISSFGFLATNIDRWFAAERLPASDFAQYSFAWTVLFIAQSVQAIISASFFPMLARCFAIQGGRIAYRTAVKVSLSLFVLGAVVAFPLWLVLNYSITKWFIVYQEASGLLVIFLVITVLRLSDFWSSYLMVIGHEIQLLILNVFSASVGFALWLLLIRPDSDIYLIKQLAALALLMAIIGYAAVALAAWIFSRDFRVGYG